MKPQNDNHASQLINTHMHTHAHSQSLSAGRLPTTTNTMSTKPRPIGQGKQSGEGQRGDRANLGLSSGSSPATAAMSRVLSERSMAPVWKPSRQKPPTGRLAVSLAERSLSSRLSPPSTTPSTSAPCSSWHMADTRHTHTHTHTHTQKFKRKRSVQFRNEPSVSLMNEAEYIFFILVVVIIDIIDNWCLLKPRWTPKAISHHVYKVSASILKPFQSVNEKYQTNKIKKLPLNPQALVV